MRFFFGLQKVELLLDQIHSFSSELQCWWSEPCASEQQVVVRPFEKELGDMVNLCVLKKSHWSNRREGVLSDYWFYIVVEINNVGFPEA